jgi:hypothetical protein
MGRVVSSLMVTCCAFIFSLFRSLDGSFIILDSEMVNSESALFSSLNSNRSLPDGYVTFWDQLWITPELYTGRIWLFCYLAFDLEMALLFYLRMSARFFCQCFVLARSHTALASRGGLLLFMSVIVFSSPAEGRRYVFRVNECLELSLQMRSKLCRKQFWFQLFLWRNLRHSEKVLVSNVSGSIWRYFCRVATLYACCVGFGWTPSRFANVFTGFLLPLRLHWGVLSRKPFIAK